MIRKIHLKCDNLRYGPEPKPEEPKDHDTEDKTDDSENTDNASGDNDNRKIR